MDETLTVEPTKSRRVAERIERDIRSGLLAPGARMLGMRGLAGKFEVSFAVINSAYDILEAKGLVLRLPRSGAVVNPKLKSVKTKLLGLVTSYGRDDVEDYYEPLFAIAARKRVVPMVAVLSDEGWQQTLGDLLDRQPDGLLVDVEARRFPLREMNALTAFVPVCFCNRWEWRPDTPERAVLLDYGWAYGEGLRHLRSRGHERVVLLTHHAQPQPYLLDLLRQAQAADLPRVSLEELKQNPSAADAALAGATAVWAQGDYALRQLLELRPETVKLDKIGFFNNQHSQVKGQEFSSFAPNFAAVWENAVASFDGMAKTVYVKPELLLRNQ